MKKLLLGAAFMCIAPAAMATSQTVTEDHKPNRATVACLEAPTQSCAIKAALQTVIEEDFGVERAKVLVGVARSFIEMGQKDQAIKSLMMAMEEARSVNLSIVVQQQITSVAPYLAEAGDVAGALVLTNELTQTSLKDTTLLAMSGTLLQRGDIADAKVVLSSVTNETSAFWNFLGQLTMAPKNTLSLIDYEHLVGQVQALTKVDQKYRALIRLAIVADKNGHAEDRDKFIAEADQIFPSIVSLQTRATITGERVRLMYQGGLDQALVQTSMDLAMQHGHRIRGYNEKRDFANNVGPVEAGEGQMAKALNWLEYFEKPAEKADYLARLDAGTEQAKLDGAIKNLLTEVQDVDGAYDRDLIRLKLLGGALSNKDIGLAKDIILTVEDDDNQAYGLALLAPLLP